MATISPTVSPLVSAYLEHFKEAKSYEKTYARLVIANLEESKTKNWYSAILQIIDKINQKVFFSEKDWEGKLIEIRETIRDQAKHTENPLDPVGDEELAQLKQMAAESKTMQVVLQSDFFQNIVKNYKADPEKVEEYFATSIPKYLPPNIKGIIKEVPNLESWLIKLSKITLSARERIGFIARRQAVPEATLLELAGNRAKIGGSPEMRSLNAQQFNELIGALKTYYEENQVQSEGKQ